MVGIDIGGGGGSIFQGDNLPELYKSRTMIEKTLFSIINGEKNERLIDLYVEFNKLHESWVKKPALSNFHFADSVNNIVQKRLQDSLFGVIIDDINKNYLNVAKPDKKLSIIKVEVKATNEIFAKEFNDRIVQNVNDFYVQTKTKKSLDNVLILQHKTDSVRSVMNGAIYNSAAVADATPNLNPTRQVQRTAPMQRSQFNAETNKAILSSLVQTLEMSKMTLLKETPLIQIIDKPVFPLQKTNVGKAKSSVIGGILFTILTALFFVVKKLFKEMMD